ncbi:MAG: hypothetical protein Q8L98_07940 [Chlamydiales bacterium]|nr:hypothetical protein [Chlamydiales bacterium]
MNNVSNVEKTRQSSSFFEPETLDKVQLGALKVAKVAVVALAAVAMFAAVAGIFVGVSLFLPPLSPLLLGAIMIGGSAVAGIPMGAITGGVLAAIDKKAQQILAIPSPSEVPRESAEIPDQIPFQEDKNNEDLNKGVMLRDLKSLLSLHQKLFDFRSKERGVDSYMNSVVLQIAKERGIEIAEGKFGWMEISISLSKEDVDKIKTDYRFKNAKERKDENLEKQKTIAQEIQRRTKDLEKQHPELGSVFDVKSLVVQARVQRAGERAMVPLEQMAVEGAIKAIEEGLDLTKKIAYEEGLEEQRKSPQRSFDLDLAFGNLVQRKL